MWSPPTTPDLDRIGGVTGWTQAATLADASGIPLSSHLYPEVSAHLLAASPTAHWLEYVDWAAPLLAPPPPGVPAPRRAAPPPAPWLESVDGAAPLGPEPLPVTAGAIAASERPGVGLSWDDDAVAHYRRD